MVWPSMAASKRTRRKFFPAIPREHYQDAPGTSLESGEVLRQSRHAAGCSGGCEPKRVAEFAAFPGAQTVERETKRDRLTSQARKRLRSRRRSKLTIPAQ